MDKCGIRVNFGGFKSVIPGCNEERGGRGFSEEDCSTLSQRKLTKIGEVWSVFKELLQRRNWRYGHAVVGLNSTKQNLSLHTCRPMTTLHLNAAYSRTLVLPVRGRSERDGVGGPLQCVRWAVGVYDSHVIGPDKDAT